MKQAEWIVQESAELLKFLFQNMPNRGRNAVKAILTRGQVEVNGTQITQHNHKLHAGDIVVILTGAPASMKKLAGLEILFEDDDILVIQKDAGLLTIATENEKHLTAYRQLSDYVQQKNARNRLFIVHRLDRDTSGVMLFAKSKDMQQQLQNSWQESVQERGYIALVEGEVRKSGTVTSWLWENKAMVMVSSQHPNDGKKAITHYEVLQSNRRFSLLKVRLETGRKNQIRVHMKDIGHPVVGDKKYGSRQNPIRRLGLHAQALAFTHPKTGKEMRFETEIPAVFLRSFS